MTAPGASAVSLALALVRAPAGVNAARAARFSKDVTAVLRLVAEDAATTQQMMVATGASAAELREAAEFYLLQVCFMPGIDSFRVLAANRDDVTTHIRDHYRLLVRWLHPDRNSDPWQTVFLDRVNRAWRDLRGSEERAEYEHNVPPGVEHGDAPLLAAGLPLTVTGLGSGTLGKRISARTMRRLPGMVLAGLGTFAVLVLAVMYLAHDGRPVAESGYEATETPNAAAVPASSRFVRTPKPDAGVVSSVDVVESAAVESTASVAATAAADQVEPPAAAPELASTQPPSVEKPLAPTLAKRQVMPRRNDADLSQSPPGTAVEPPPAVADVVGAAPAASTRLERQDSAVSPKVGEAVVASPASSIASADATSLPQDAYPAASGPVVAASAGAGVDQLLVDDLLERFRSAYSDGDLIGLMALFTRDARNIAQGSKRLADDYRELFRTSRARQLSLHDMTWWREGDMVAVVASFDAAITPLGRARPKHIGGDIRFELRHEDGEVRIARIRHQAQ